MLTALALILLSAEPDYQRARWDPIHFKPAIERASDEQCLACHREVLEPSVLPASPAGVASKKSLAWYQTLSTYEGEQDTFHRRHLVSQYATQVMQLRCNTCHQGNSPRDEVSGSSATAQPDLTMRKMVDPQLCLMCHGRFPNENMGVPGSWTEFGKLFANNCLTCHVAIRTQRHQVNYLKPDAIEQLGAKNADVCFGCHGGRQWYRTSFPYPRHAWPGAADVIPEWAKDRPTQSPPRFLVAPASPPVPTP